MTIDDVHREFFRLEQGGLQRPQKQTELEAKVNELAKSLQSMHLTDDDKIRLRELSGRVSTEIPGSRLDILFNRIIRGVVEEKNIDLDALLHLPPPGPQVNDRVDRTVLAQWVDAHPPSAREAAQALASQVRCVGQEEFEQTFSRALDQFNQILPAGASYSVGVQAEKSNMWTAQLALSSGTLRTNPTRAVPLHYSKETCPEHLVLFDDASMSGEQLGRIVDQFSNRSTEDKGNLKTISIVCAYMTDHAKKKLEKQKQELVSKGITLNLVIGANLPTIAQAIRANPPRKSESNAEGTGSITEEDETGEEPSQASMATSAGDGEKKEAERIIKALNRMYQPPSVARAGEKEMARKKEELKEITSVLTPLCFAHKIPDDRSFPKALAEGNIHTSNGKALPIEKIKAIYDGLEPYKKREADLLE